MSDGSNVVRSVYRAEWKTGATAQQAEDLVGNISALRTKIDHEILTVSLFQWDEMLFIYSEGIDSPFDPNTHLDCGDLGLAKWPGGESGARWWVPMMDIFHYNQPKDVGQWRRKAPVDIPFGRVIRLRPDMVSSYIFYHYQLQEERLGFGDKYGIIVMHENLLFFYQENPRVIEDAPFPGKLETTNTPSGWQELMGKHFAPWTDRGEEIWRPIELLVTIGL